MTTRIKFYRRPAGASDSQRIFLGTASNSEGPDCWRFYPNSFGRSPSRKPHATWEACLPRWVEFPHGCESEFSK
jgi:hypothetical protein